MHGAYFRQYSIGNAGIRSENAVRRHIFALKRYQYDYAIMMVRG